MGLYRFDHFVFDASTGELSTPDGHTVFLRHKVGALLDYLLKHRERLVTKDELLGALWQHGDYRESSLTQSVRELRRALGDRAKSPNFIKTYPQRGYQWVCPLNQEAPSERAPESLVFKVTQARPAIVLMAVLIVLAVFIGTRHWPQGPVSESRGEVSVPRLLVLPFVNDTGDSERDWLELGLSDMLATRIQRSGLVKVTPPAMANNLVLSAGLEWPTLPAYIRGLLQREGYDQALIASVSDGQDGEVLDFRLLLDDGRTRLGSMTYSSLAGNTEAMAHQLLFLIRPDSEVTGSIGDPYSQDRQLAEQALAQGISAMQTSGPARARDYFQAAVLLDENGLWASAFKAKSYVLLGQWNQAKSQLEQLENTGDPSLDAFTAYWRAELAYRVGDDRGAQELLAQAMRQAETNNNTRVLANVYRLQARLAWSERQWQEHWDWLERANQLLPRKGDLRIEAEKLFYLGNPISKGPEKDPQQDLLLSRERLTKALNYYTQLDHRPMMAASQFALAQNYKLDIDRRQRALKQALADYEQMQQPYELVEVLIYASFFYLQLHDGAAAQHYVTRAERVVERLGSHRLEDELGFYRAFALLDQGLDQSHNGRHGQQPALLRRAIEAFETLITSTESEATRANSLVLLGWAHSDLGGYVKARQVLEEGRRLSARLGMDTSFGYAIYSLMRVHLETGNYAQVLELGREPVTTRQQLSYKARAHYELGQFSKARETLELLQERFPEQWNERDAERLVTYQNAELTGTQSRLAEEQPAHAVYCESDWLLSS